jgi:glutathione S-transferase
MKLFGYPGTRSSRVHWLLEELGIPYEHVVVDIRKGEHKSPEHLARHPHGFIPAAEIDGEKLIESVAMCLELADRVPEKRLAPPIGTRKRYYEHAIYTVSTLDPTFIPLYLHMKLLPPEARKDEVVAEKKPTADTAIALLSERLGKQTWLLGDDFTAADVIVGYALALAADCELLAGTPLAPYVGRLSERPAFKKAFAR